MSFERPAKSLPAGWRGGGRTAVCVVMSASFPWEGEKQNRFPRTGCPGGTIRGDAGGCVGRGVGRVGGRVPRGRHLGRRSVRARPGPGPGPGAWGLHVRRYVLRAPARLHTSPSGVFPGATRGHAPRASPGELMRQYGARAAPRGRCPAVPSREPPVTQRRCRLVSFPGAVTARSRVTAPVPSVRCEWSPVRRCQVRSASASAGPSLRGVREGRPLLARQGGATHPPVRPPARRVAQYAPRVLLRAGICPKRLLG